MLRNPRGLNTLWMHCISSVFSLFIKILIQASLWHMDLLLCPNGHIFSLYALYCLTADVPSHEPSLLTCVGIESRKGPLEGGTKTTVSRWMSLWQGSYSILPPSFIPPFPPSPPKTTESLAHDLAIVCRPGVKTLQAWKQSKGAAALAISTQMCYFIFLVIPFFSPPSDTAI